jgi:hypothetical protein
LADRAAGLQLMRFSIDRDGVDVTLEASFAMAVCLSETHTRMYRWCSPPKTGTANV